MPPKKAVAAKSDVSEGEGDKFSWTPENERKLFLFMIGTTSFSKEDTERLAEHAFKGTSASAVKQRANKIRVEHRALYEDYGWPTPDGKPAVKATGTPKKKRAADGDDAPATPAKKGKKGKKGKAANEEPPSNDMGGAIKAEESDM